VRLCLKKKKKKERKVVLAYFMGSLHKEISGELKKMLVYIDIKKSESPLAETYASFIFPSLNLCLLKT
jgi:hypothetical protein